MNGHRKRLATVGAVALFMVVGFALPLPYGLPFAFVGGLLLDKAISAIRELMP